jgi:hypothetical protein
MSHVAAVFAAYARDFTPQVGGLHGVPTSAGKRALDIAGGEHRKRVTHYCQGETVAENCGKRSAESPNYNHTGAPMLVDIMSRVRGKLRVATKKATRCN